MNTQFQTPAPETDLLAESQSETTEKPQSKRRPGGKVAKLCQNAAGPGQYRAGFPCFGSLRQNWRPVAFDIPTTQHHHMARSPPRMQRTFGRIPSGYCAQTSANQWLVKACEKFHKLNLIGGNGLDYVLVADRAR